MTPIVTYNEMPTEATFYAFESKEFDCDAVPGSSSFEDAINALDNAIRADPKSVYYMQNIKILAFDEEDEDDIQEWDDIYNDYRDAAITPYLLSDPEENIPALYQFRENGLAVFFAHFDHDAPVNNENGFQGLSFDEEGRIEKVAVVDRKQRVHEFAMNDEWPEKIVYIRDNLRDFQAPTRKTIIKTMAGILGKPGENLQAAHARHHKNEI